MTKRVALGNITINSTDTKGFFISQKSDDVTNFTKPLEVHSGVGAGLHVFYRAQGSITAPQMLGSYGNNWPPSPTYADITHNWGTSGGHATDERPLFAVRWNRPQDLSFGGKAARVFTPNNASFFSQDTTLEGDPDEDEGQEENQVQLEYAEGCKVSHQSNNVIRIQNFNLGIAGDDQSFVQGNTLYYAIVVFYEHDWTGGNGL